MSFGFEPKRFLALATEKVYTYVSGKISAATFVDTENAETEEWVTGTEFQTKEGTKRATDTVIYGGIEITSPLTGFGELLVAEPTPSVQIDALQNIVPDVHETFTGVSGTATIKNDHGGREFEVTSGTSVGGFGIVRSRDVIRYRPGQGCRIRFTSRWGTPVALSTQRAGGVASGVELSFGYIGTTFGILHRTGGRLAIQTLTITTPASGNETLTLTLNGNVYNVDVTSGTAAHNAYEISIDPAFAATHNAYQNGDTVVFLSKAVGVEAGTFSVLSAGALVGSFSQNAAGRIVSDNFIDQADWNQTTLLGATDSFILDHTKGNVFQIVYQYLGYGALFYSVENPNTGMFELVHVIKYSNNNVVPSLDSPVFRIGWFAASLGATTDTEMHGASAAGFIDGITRPLKNPVGRSNTKNVGTTLTNILSVRTRSTFNGYSSVSQLFPRFVSIAVDGTKPAVAEIHINATIAGEPNWTYQKENSSIAEYDVAGTTVSSTDTEIFPISLSREGSEYFDLKDLDIKVNAGDVITLAARATSGNTDATASFTWLED